MADWSRFASAAFEKHIREVEDNLMKKRVILALLKKRGKISYGNGGTKFDWRVKYARAPLLGYADADTLSFPRRNRWKVAELDYRGYDISESCTKKEWLATKTQEGIVKILNEIATNITDDMEDIFNGEIYLDGNGSGRGKFIHGLESCLARHSSATGASGKTRDPDDSYAEWDTDLAAYGGTWTGDWPDGDGSAEYDFWSPILIDETNTTGWGTGSTFALNGLKQVRFGITKSQSRKSAKGKTDLVLMSDTDWVDFVELVEVKERVVTNRGQNNSAAISLGFDAINYLGADIMWEPGVPANTKYGINTSMMELLSMQPQLFVETGPEYRPETKSYLCSVDFFGNLKMNPRSIFKIYPYT